MAGQRASRAMLAAPAAFSLDTNVYGELRSRDSDGICGSNFAYP